MLAYTIADIARMAGVSKATVSRVINEKPAGVSEQTRMRIQHIIDEAQYRPNSLARGMAISRSSTIGVIIPDIANHFYNVVLRGIDDVISAKGYSMLLCNSDNGPAREQHHLLSFLDKRVDGVILCSGLSNEQFLRDYRKQNMPLVLIGRLFDSCFSDAAVTGDNLSGAAEAVNHLIQSGNRRILYLDGKPGTSGMMQRQQGYTQALRQAGLPIDPRLVRPGEFSILYGYQTVSRALDEGLDFTAVFSGSDLAAIGAIKALLERGIRVPEQIEVIGFDDLDLASIFEPPLSTVYKPHYEMAADAARMLLSVIDGEKAPSKQIVYASRLVLRGTTRPLPALQSAK